MPSASMPKKSTLTDLISEAGLESLAGEKYFERGRAYFCDGAVEILYRDEREISGWVTGTETYAVRLWVSREMLNWACTCPLGERAEFCKHLVATGLTLLGNELNAADATTSPEARAIHALLKNGDRQLLETIMLRHAARDGALAADLLVAAQKIGLNDPAAVKERIRKAFNTRGFVDYARMPSLVARAAPIPDLLRANLAAGDTETTFELSTFAARHGLKALEHCDDSDGGMGGIVNEIAAIHLQAAAQGASTPTALAKNLFELQLADGFGFFALEAYLPALGKTGFATYRGLAQQAWKKIPPLLPGSSEDGEDGQRWQLTAIMTTLAHLDEDTDALVDVLRRNLTQPYTYLEIAETLSKVKRHDEALKWAEDGRKAFKNQLNIPLDDFLVAEYHRRKRHDDAVALRWSRFKAHPNLDGYRKLKAAAGRAKNWKFWREKAITLLREPTSAKPQSRDVFSYVESRTLVLIQVYLWESDPRAALEVARTSECPSHLWLRIARALEEPSPSDAIAIYQAQVEPIVQITNNNAYDEAAGIVRRIRDLMTSTGKGAEFAPYLDALRVQHKVKRNFIQRLDKIAKEKTG